VYNRNDATLTITIVNKVQFWTCHGDIATLLTTQAMGWLLKLIYQKDTHIPGLPPVIATPENYRGSSMNGHGNNCFIAATLQVIENVDPSCNKT
jgi:hypothetical protein